MNQPSRRHRTCRGRAISVDASQRDNPLGQDWNSLRGVHDVLVIPSGPSWVGSRRLDGTLEQLQYYLVVMWRALQVGELRCLRLGTFCFRGVVGRSDPWTRNLASVLPTVDTSVCGLAMFQG